MRLVMAQVIGAVGTATLSWRNPPVGAENIAAINISYQSNNSGVVISTLLTDPEFTLSDGAEIMYQQTGLVTGTYSFNIEALFTAALAEVNTREVEVLPQDVMVFSPGTQLAPTLVVSPADAATRIS